MRITEITYQLGSVRETLDDLQSQNPDWRIQDIASRTGILTRYVTAPQETAFQLAIKAAQKLAVDRNTIDALIYVTQSPESLIPTTACLLHQHLGLPSQCLAYDLNQGCSGFIYGLSQATALIKSGLSKHALVVCAEAYSKYISKNDRTCRPLFSDGAAAIMVEESAVGDIGPFVFVTDGSGAPNLTLRRQVVDTNLPAGSLYMDGAKVLLFTMGQVPRAVRELLAKAQLSVQDIDLFIFHQASKVVLDNIQHALKIDEDRLFRNYQEVGNTVSATIPIALVQAQQSGRIKDGTRVLLMGFGVGYSLAGCIVTL